MMRAFFAHRCDVRKIIPTENGAVFMNGFYIPFSDFREISRNAF